MVKINEETCIGCSKCVKDCPAGVLVIENKKAKCTGPCILCGHCAAVCPVNAITITDYDENEVIENTNTAAFDIDELLTNIKLRRSIRNYKNKPVEQEKLDKIIEAARYTATAKNFQACRFVVVQDELDTLKEKVWGTIDETLANAGEEKTPIEEAFQFLADNRTEEVDYIFKNAPVAVYILAENKIDAGLAAQNIEHAAVAQGLGVLYNGYLAIATELSEDACNWLETDGKPIATTVLIGYPDVNYKRSTARRKADVIFK